MNVNSGKCCYVTNRYIIRFFDLVLSILGLIFFTPAMVLIFFLILIEIRAPIFWQKRLGQNQTPFTLIKFRTMKTTTVSVATHLAHPDSVTYFGGFLRRTKLDEVPQLWNVLRGEMSLVGPRPSLMSQTEVIEARQKLGVFSVRPGITGLAQIKGVDMSTPKLLAETDAEMISGMSVTNYFKYILLTLTGHGLGDLVKKTK